MKKIFVILMMLVISLSGVAVKQLEAGAIPATIIPENALWVVHMDMERFRQTQLSDLFRDDRYVPFTVAKEVMKAYTRIDLLNDTTAITFFGMEGGENAVVCLAGSYDREFLISRMQEAPGYRETRLGETVVHRWKDSRFCVLVNDRLLVYSIHPLDESSLKMVLDTVVTGNKNISGSPLMAQLQRMPKRAYLKAATANLSAFGFGKDESRLLKNTGMALFLAMEKDGIVLAKLTLTTDQPETAVNIEQVVKGFIALGRMKHDAQDREIAFLNGIRTRRDGNVLVVEINFPVDQLTHMLGLRERKHSMHMK